MKLRIRTALVSILLAGIFSCANATPSPRQSNECNTIDSIPPRNRQVIDTIVRYGSIISPTYKKAVCTELLIPIIGKFHKLSRADKSRIRIITNENVQDLLKKDSPIPKGVYYALIEKDIGEPIEDINKVMPGDFVQFWTNTWGHCGVIRGIDIENMTMEMYSSFPSTDGYGIQRFKIPEHCFFVRMK